MRAHAAVFLLATVASTAMGSPAMLVSFAVTIDAPCEFDVDPHPQTINLVLAQRGVPTTYPVALKFKAKTIDQGGGVHYAYEGQSSFPSGDYDTRWPDAKFPARVWRLKNGVAGSYTSSPQCARRDRSGPLESTMLGAFPSSAFLGFLPGATSKTFSARLGGGLPPPTSPCPDTGCR